MSSTHANPDLLPQEITPEREMHFIEELQKEEFPQEMIDRFVDTSTSFNDGFIICNGFVDPLLDHLYRCLDQGLQPKHRPHFRGTHSQIYARFPEQTPHRRHEYWLQMVSEMGLMGEMNEQQKQYITLVQRLMLEKDTKERDRAALMEITLSELLEQGLPGSATEEDLVRLSIWVNKPAALRLTLRQLRLTLHAKQLAHIIFSLHEQDFFSFEEMTRGETFDLFRPFLPDPRHFADNTIRDHLLRIHPSKEAQQKD